jgi:FAD/FMN-containing dehydrogenase
VGNLLLFQKKQNAVVRALSWTGVAVSVAALGLYVGWELRVRYKFSHRTPYDYYTHAGDRNLTPDYAMGV